MPSRREFLTQTAAVGVAAATSLHLAHATDEEVAVKSTAVARNEPRIKSLIRREETIKRHGGVGDCWHMSWAADDRQYVSLCDGFGFSGQSQYLYNCRMFSIEGGPHDARFQDLPGYPLLSYYPSQKLADPRYYPFGTLALDGRLYQFMSTFNRGLLPGDFFGAGEPTDDTRRIIKAEPWRFSGAKLIFSPDNGRTWCNQDGSTPVVWESWAQRSRQTMVFFEEPQEAFSMLSVLQMGRNYEFNRDGYVYIYAPNGNTEGTMNELVMFRVPKTQVLNRSGYEYFAGMQSGGSPTWNKDMDARKPVLTFPRGWVNPLGKGHPYAWLPSVVYNAPLGVYLMTSWGIGTTADGDWFGKPSYLGFWTAPQPWGPWTQIHEETAWLSAGRETTRGFQPQIAPKWVAPDGKSFWLVWTDGQRQGEKAAFDRLNEPLRKKRFDEYTRADWALRYELFRKFHPYYSFNTQRVDLVVA